MFMSLIMGHIVAVLNTIKELEDKIYIKFYDICII